jgi:hypothetical protein
MAAVSTAGNRSKPPIPSGARTSHELGEVSPGLKKADSVANSSECLRQRSWTNNVAGRIQMKTRCRVGFNQ